MSEKYLYNQQWKLIPNWEALHGLMIMMFFDFLGFTFFLRGIVFYPIDETLLPFLLFFFMGLMMLNIILWNLNGKEIIQVTNEKIVLKKTGKLLTTINTIDRYELESIHFENFDKLKGNLYKFNDGKIVFKYLGMEKRIGQNLTLAEAETVVNDLNNLISTLPDVASEM